MPSPPPLAVPTAYRSSWLLKLFALTPSLSSASHLSSCTMELAVLSLPSSSPIPQTRTAVCTLAPRCVPLLAHPVGSQSLHSGPNPSPSFSSYLSALETPNFQSLSLLSQFLFLSSLPANFYDWFSSNATPTCFHILLHPLPFQQSFRSSLLPSLARTAWAQ